MLSPNEAWEATLDQLALRTSRADFETWLKGAELIGYHDGEFTVKVRHAFAKDWLERHWQHDISSTLGKTFKRAVKVTFLAHAPNHATAQQLLCEAGPLFAALTTTTAPAEPLPSAPPAAVTPKPDSAESSEPDQTAASVATVTVPPAAGGESRAEPAKSDYSEWDPRVTDVRNTSELDRVPANADDMPLIPDFTFETFVTGPSNEFAHAAAKAVADAPGTRYNPLVVFGGVGLGKTHLLHAIGHANQQAGRRALYVSAETFTNETIAAIRGRKTEELRQRYRNVDVLLVDDFQFMAGKTSTEEEFYHTFNTIVGKGGQVVLATNEHPHQITKLDDRLRSRLEGGLITDIQAPEQETRQAILRVKSTAQGIILPDDVARTLAQQAVENVRELEGLLTQVLARAQLGRLPLTVALAEQVLKLKGLQHIHTQPSPPNIDNILKATATFHQLSLDDLLSKRRTQKIARARQIAMYLVREETSASLPQIGEAFGGRNHSTILYGYNKIAEAMKEDGGLRDEVASIRQSLFSND